MGMTSEEYEFAKYLIQLAIFCAQKDAWGCDILIPTRGGKINCHIEFSDGGDVDDD